MNDRITTDGRIFKCVRSYELELSTSNGWSLEGPPHTESDMIEGSARHESYKDEHGYTRERRIDREELGTVLIFVVSKPIDAVARETEMSKHLNNAIASRRQAELDREAALKGVQKLAGDVNQLKCDLAQAKEYAKADLERTERFAERARKCEADIAKIRNAIGEIRMREILDEGKT
jgi:hypothetical protein